MNRRDTLKALGAMAGGSLLAPSIFADFLRIGDAITDGAGQWMPRIVSATQSALLPDLVETIIPATDTPGAKEALVHVFVDLYVKDCYPEAQQKVFLAGLDNVEAVSQKEFGRGFLALARDERLGLLKRLERESWEKHEPLEQSFIKMLKNLTLLGFFSSKIGATKAAEYVRTPGPFEGCIDLKPGQKVHALD